MASITSHLISVPALEEGPADLARADLVFYGVDHSGPSYEGRLFLNAPDADAATDRTPGAGYAGSYWVFGHGGCFGDVGHCDVPQGPRAPFDLRRPHALIQIKTVIVTEAVQSLVNAGTQTFTVTVVPIVADYGDLPVGGDLEDPVRFERVRLLIYEP